MAMESKLIRVLLVEDDARFARSLREGLSSLTSARIELTVAATLGAAIHELDEKRFDAVLTGLCLPDSNGLAAFLAIHAQFPSAPIIVLAGFDNETLALEAVRQGAQDYLVKSKFEGRMLSRVIRYAIERKKLERRSSAQLAVTSALAESTTLRQAAPRILQAIGESLEWPAGVLWQAEESARQLRCLAMWHASSARVRGEEPVTRQFSYAKGIGLPGRIWETGEPSWIINAGGDPNFTRAPVASRERWRAAFGFPAKVGQQVSGVIEFFSPEIQQPDEDLLRMMAIIGSQIGQFIVRKHAEEALAEERNILRTLVDTLPDAIYVKDTQSRFILGNVGVARLMGVDKAESLVGKTDFDFFPNDLAQRYHADERAILESGQAMINREEPVVDPSGARGWLLTTKAPLRDTRGQTIGLVGSGRNITERKHEEEAHRLVEARLQAILDNTTAVIYLKDTEGRYLLVNRQFEDLFHVTRQQVVNKTDFDIFPPKMAKAFQINDRKVLERRTALEFEEIAPHDQDLRTYISIKFPLSDAAGVPYAVCGISTDITERKRAEMQLIDANVELLEINDELGRSEEALRQALSDLRASHDDLRTAQLQLIHAEKMESIGTLAAGVAHEVKNPLQTILMGLAYLGKNLAVGNENIAMALSDMRDAVRRADAIVRDLLHLSAAKQIELKEGDFNAVIEHSLCLVNYELNRARIELARGLDPDLPGVRFDKAKMEQVFINLFMNAIQAMPHGGTLSIRTSSRRWGDADSTNDRKSSPIQPGDLVVVAEIDDTGVGIPKEKLDRIFEPFFTTKPAGMGTGLGLPVTKQIVELHGGVIEIKPRNTSGVRVMVALKAETK
ncbi:MAG TPA: PAS domain-containing protein [Candidatus Nitrosotalea sp.]|nr:PAS domain-containing protein [Candidatus Nitrosotalea sp.]